MLREYWLRFVVVIALTALSALGVHLLMRSLETPQWSYMISVVAVPFAVFAGTLQVAIRDLV